MPTVIQIVREHLVAGGFDGLVNRGACGCLLSDLHPCGESFAGCEPAFRGAATGDDEPESWSMYASKAAAQASLAAKSEPALLGIEVSLAPTTDAASMLDTGNPPTAAVAAGGFTVSHGGPFAVHTLPPAAAVEPELYAVHRPAVWTNPEPPPAQTITRLEFPQSNAAPPEPATSTQHGVNCEKVLHSRRGGYLHADDDDAPYDVDGGDLYCGRCHEWLCGIVPPPEPATLSLGAINALLDSRLHVSAAGLALLGIEATAAGKAKMYRKSDVQRICIALRTFVQSVLDDALRQEIVEAEK